MVLSILFPPAAEESEKGKGPREASHPLVPTPPAFQSGPRRGRSSGQGLLPREASRRRTRGVTKGFSGSGSLIFSFAENAPLHLLL